MCPSAEQRYRADRVRERESDREGGGNVAQVRKMSSDKQKPLTLNLEAKNKKKKTREGNGLPISV